MNLLFPQNENQKERRTFSSSRCRRGFRDVKLDLEEKDAE